MSSRFLEQNRNCLPNSYFSTGPSQASSHEDVDVTFKYAKLLIFKYLPSRLTEHGGNIFVESKTWQLSDLRRY
jgi:hypothetical protein